MPVTVIGDAFVDILVPIHSISRGETHHRNIGISYGGTANVAIQIAKHGERVKFIGRVGNDALGAYFTENLKKHNVEVLTDVDEEHPTGLCVSLVYEDGERTMIASRGANDYLDKSIVESKIGEILASRIVYFSGYSLLKNAEVIQDLMHRCKGKVEIWFNPGAPNIITDLFSETVNSFVDVLILNLDEAKAMTGEENTTNIMVELERIAGLSVVSQGGNGCIVSGGEGWTRVAADQVMSGIDSTGAGDAFAAGFIVGRLQGMDEVACARLANRVAVNFLKEKGCPEL